MGAAKAPLGLRAGAVRGRTEGLSTRGQFAADNDFKSLAVGVQDSLTQVPIARAFASSSARASAGVRPPRVLRGLPERKRMVAPEGACGRVSDVWPRAGWRWVGFRPARAGRTGTGGRWGAEGSRIAHLARAGPSVRRGVRGCTLVWHLRRWRGGRAPSPALGRAIGAGRGQGAGGGGGSRAR
jgi:hypothetical protein